MPTDWTRGCFFYLSSILFKKKLNYQYILCNVKRGYSNGENEAQTQIEMQRFKSLFELGPYVYKLGMNRFAILPQIPPGGVSRVWRFRAPISSFKAVSQYIYIITVSL